MEVLRCFVSEIRPSGRVLTIEWQDAQRAIAELNDTDLKGRLVFVREDRESGAVGGGGGGGGGGLYVAGHGGGGGVSVGRRVYVGNLSWQVQWQDLKDHMRQVGEVVYADVMIGTQPM